MKDGDGLISADEVRQEWESWGLNPTDDEVDKRIRNSDVNGDGQVNYDEFTMDFLTAQQRVQQIQTKRNRNQHGHNKIDAAKLANLKKDFPGLAEALGGLFFQGEARVRRHEEEEHGERPQGQDQDELILNGKGPLSLHKGD